MSGDEIPPNVSSHDRPTLDELPPGNDTEPPLAVIPRGLAQIAVSAALDDLVRAFQLLEATAMAIARQLDAMTEEAP